MKLLTPEQIEDIRDYWTLPPRERDARFGEWPVRIASDDIRTLCDHLLDAEKAAVEGTR